MQRDFGFNFDEDPQVEQGFLMNKRGSKNDSIGNNSGGMRSNRDQDFDMMNDMYEDKMQNKIDQQNQQLEQGEVLQIGPENNSGSKHNNHQQISLYDIQTNLCSKTISIINFKKTLQTIINCLHAFQLDELTKFARLIMDLPAFDSTFQNQNHQNNKMEIQPNQLHQVSSDISAKSDSPYTLPSSGMQTIFEIAVFFNSLVDKCTNIDNMHLIPVLRQILNQESRFYMLPLRPEDLIEQSRQFVENSNNDQRYQEVEEGIQQSYVSLFEFSDQVNSIKLIWYLHFGRRCINNCFKKNSTSHKLSTKMRIHGLRILNELNDSSPELFIKFNFDREESNYIIEQKSEITKMQKPELQQYSNALFDCCCKHSTKIRLYLSLIIENLINAENPIQKKTQALRMIQKLILNTKQWPQTIDTVAGIVEQHLIVQQLMRDQTHSQLLRKLPSIIIFLYDLGKIGTDQLKSWIRESVKGHEQFYRVVQQMVDNLRLKDLAQIFGFVKCLLVAESQLLNAHGVGLIQSIVGNYNLSARKKHKQSSHNSNTSQLQGQGRMLDEQKQQRQSKQKLDEISRLAQELFKYLFQLIQNPQLQNLYIPIFTKHINFHLPLLLPLLQQQFKTRLSKPKNYQTYFLSILQHCLKMNMELVSTHFYQQQTDSWQKQIQQNQKQHNSSESKNTKNVKKTEGQFQQEQRELRKYQFITNLVLNCNIYDSIFVMLSKCRFDKAITEKCLNVLVLITKYYKCLEKSHIQILWRILGEHYTNDFEKEQFFMFVKDIMKNEIGLSEEAAKHIYFQILLKLSHDYFTPKIYHCLEILFMRLNQDAGILVYEKQKRRNNCYRLKDVDLIGIEKFHYLLMWSEKKVSTKVKDFLFKLYSCKSSQRLKQQLSFQIITSIMQYLRRNPQSETHLLLAGTHQQFNQHVFRAFDLFSKFNNQSPKYQSQNEQQSSIISVTINNVTKQALPPIKKTIQVQNNILLKDFKQLIRKHINPEVIDIQLINKGKALKAERMTLKQLKIDNKNTILVENMDLPPQKQSLKDQKLKENIQTLQAIFAQQYSSQLLRYVAEKYLGEQLEKICQWVMDDQKMKQLETQMNEKGKGKIEEQEKYQNSKANHQLNQQIILSFSQILMSEVEQLLRGMSINKEQRWHKRTQKRQREGQRQIRVDQKYGGVQQNWGFRGLIQLLLEYEIDKKLCEQMLKHVKPNIMNYLNGSQPGFYFKLSQLMKGYELYQLVLKYQDVFLQFYFSLSQPQSNPFDNQKLQYPSQSIHYFFSSYSSLKTYIDHIHAEESSEYPCKKPIQWLYSLLVSYCDIITKYENCYNTSVRPQIFQNDLFDSVNLLISRSLTLSNNYILSILALINKLIDKVFVNAQKSSRKLSNQHLRILQNFSDFLFQPFIFNLNTVPLLTDNLIKLNYYQLLLKLASSSNVLLLKISSSVIKLGIQDRNRDHDNIDFKKNQFVGIQNLGCTCYINSLIQQLYHTRLPYKLITLTNNDGLFQLKHTFMQLYMTVKNAINIRPMIQQVKFYGQQIIPTIQQDVEEFLISLLDYIESCQGKQIIDSIFGGSYSEELTFFSQRQSGKTFKKHKEEHFYNITLDIKGKKSLNQALTYFFRAQTLDDKILCQQLGQKTSVVKRSFIKRFPKILIFTLKRFEFDVQNMVRKKLNDYLEFPLELELTQFSYEKLILDEKRKQNTQVERSNQNILIGSNTIDASRQNVETGKIDESEYHLYMLCGILIHSGSAEAGHYYSYIHRQNKWYEFNDKTVNEIDLSQIIKQDCFGGGQSKSRNAYMLFYQKIQTTPQQQNNPNNHTQQKIEIQSPNHQVQIDRTIPLEVQQRHQGIFFQAIPDDNYFKQLVMDENRLFIKQRLFYDGYYRKFVSQIIPLIRQAKANNPYKTQFDRREEYLLSEQLVEIQKIDNVLNSKVEKAIVHYQSNQMMEIEGMKEMTYEEEERIQQERTRMCRQNDIVGQILDQNLKHDFI